MEAVLFKRFPSCQKGPLPAENIEGSSVEINVNEISLPSKINVNELSLPSEIT